MAPRCLTPAANKKQLSLTLIPEDLEALYQEELRRTAYHEAGHAVLYAFFKIPFTTAEIFTDEHPEPPELSGYAGIVTSRADLEDWPYWAIPECEGFFDQARADKYVDDLICISHGGRAAESVFIGQLADRSVARHDRKWVRGFCSFWPRLKPSEIEKRSARMWPVAQALMATPAIWRAVTAVAEALLISNVLTQSKVLTVVREAEETLVTLRPARIASSSLQFSGLKPGSGCHAHASQAGTGSRGPGPGNDATGRN